MIYPLGNVRAVIFKPGMPLKDWLAKQTVKPFALINASLYDMTTCEPVGTIIENSLFVHNDGNGFGFGYDANGWSFGKPWDKNYTEYITGYTGLVQDGKYVAPAFTDTYVFNKFLFRIGLGEINGELAVMTKDAVNIEQFGQEAKESGFKSFINLDGGGSRFLFLDGKTIYSSTRVPYNAIAFYKLEDKSQEPVTKPNAFTVCLDAGHGKAEAYNQSPDGTYQEYEFTLDMARRIKLLLEQNSIEVVMTRTDDSTPSLQARCDTANQANADLFISIHSNAVSGGWNNASGLAVFTYAEGGERNRAAQAILGRMKEAGISLLADRIYYAKYHVLANTNMPAVLVEYGFHTNKADVEKLKTSVYRDKLATATAKAICDYLGIAYKEPPPSRVYRVQIGAFNSIQNAINLANELVKKGYKAIIKED